MLRGLVATAAFVATTAAPPLLLAGSAAADGCANATTWTGSGTAPDDWADPGNWTAGVPDGTYAVTMTLAGGQTIADSTNPTSDPVCDFTLTGAGTGTGTLSAPVATTGNVIINGSPDGDWSMALPAQADSLASIIVNAGTGGATGVTVGALSSSGALTANGGDATHGVTLTATSLTAPTVTTAGTVTLDTSSVTGALTAGDGTTAATLTLPSDIAVSSTVTLDQAAVGGPGALSAGALALSGLSDITNALTVTGNFDIEDGAAATVPATSTISGALNVLGTSLPTSLTLNGSGPTVVHGLSVNGVGTASVVGGLSVQGLTALNGSVTLSSAGTTFNGAVTVGGAPNGDAVSFLAPVTSDHPIVVQGASPSGSTVLTLASGTDLPNGVSIDSTAGASGLTAAGPVALGSLVTKGPQTFASSLAGQFSVGTMTVLGVVTTTDGSAFDVSGPLSVGVSQTQSASLQLGDGAHIVANGPVTLGNGPGGTSPPGLLQGPVSPSSAPYLMVNQSLALQSLQNASVIRVAIDVASSAFVDVRGKVLSITGPSLSTFADRSVIKDTMSSATSTSGVVDFLGSATLALQGTTTVSSPATLRMSAQSTLDGVSPTVTGTGLFVWRGGGIVRDLTMDVNSKLDGASSATDRRLPTGVTLTNLGTMDFTGPNAAIGVNGVLDNRGKVTLRAGATVGGAGTITNESGKVLEIAAPSSNTTGGAVTVTGPSVRNFGTLTIPAGDTLKLAADPLVAGSGAGSLIADGSKVAGGGVLQVGAGSTTTLRGTTTFAPGADVQSGQQTFKQPAILLVDGGSGTANLVGDPSSPATLTGTAVTDGALVWCSGTLSGSIKVQGVTTEAGTGLYGPACGSTTAAVLAGDATNKASLTLNGPASINSIRVSLHPHSQVSLGGATTFGGNPSGFDHSNIAVDDEQVTVAKTGSVTVASLSLTRPTGQTTSSTKSTIDVPFVNHGSFTANGSPIDVTGSLLDTDGTFTVAGTTVNVPSAPFTNEGTVTVQGSGTATAKFAVPKGYTQSARSGLADPVTGVFANSTLTTNDGAGHTTPVAINAGGMGGDGTIEASQVSMGSAWLHPGTSAASGTMNIKGALALSGGSDLQIVIRAPASGTTSPVHDLLKVSGAATISGQITGITASGYKPAYLSIVKDVFDFASHTGVFTKTSWSGTPTGLGWKPVALTSTAKQVDLQLVDVAPPSLGIASIPAFTEFASQRVTYAAVDNRTGVKSYDVRWRRGDPTHAFSGWHYPTSWQHTKATYEIKSGLAAGWEYCFSVRARDGVGNITPWSVPLCTTRMLDDKALSAHGLWKRPTGKAGFYVKTYSQTTRLGAYLTRAPGTFTRVGVIAYSCPKCGVVGIYSGKTLLKKWNLRASKTKLVNWISPLLKSRYARLTIKSLTSRKTVVVDAIGLMR